jgi:hypothetical protein
MKRPPDMTQTRPYPFRPAPLAAFCALVLCVLAAPLPAQTARAMDAASAARTAPAMDAVDAAPPAAIALKLEALDWVAGCWQGEVNGREFREQWLPLRGGMLVGVSQTVLEGRTQDFEYLRLETRPDGVWYVAVPSGKTETVFKLTSIAPEAADTVFTFSNPADQFPQRIVYRRNPKGWLYAHVEGKLNGEDKRIIYPMQRVDCQSGELLRK